MGMCNDLQFARNFFCKRCKTGKPKDPKYFPRGGAGVATSGGHFAKDAGDWVCKACGNMVHKKRDRCHYCTAPRPEATKKGDHGAHSEEHYLAITGSDAPMKALGYIAPDSKLQTNCNAWSGQWGSGLTTSSIALKPVTEAPNADAAAGKKRDASSDSPETKREKEEKKRKKEEKKGKEEKKKADAAKKEEETRKRMAERKAKKKAENTVVVNDGAVAVIDDGEVVLD